MPRIYSRRGNAKAWQAIHVGGGLGEKDDDNVQGAKEAKEAWRFFLRGG